MVISPHFSSVRSTDVEHPDRSFLNSETERNRSLFLFFFLRVKMAANTTAELTASQLSALQKHNRQETNRVRIKEVNQLCYQKSCAILQLAEPVPLDRRLALWLSDDGRPFLMHGLFVKVRSNTFSGRNRPDSSLLK